jgi:hypothetical protein
MNKPVIKSILTALLLMLVALPFISGCQKKRDLTVLKQFAENSVPYFPPETMIPRLPQVPPEVLSILKEMRKGEEKEFEKYLTLVILRTYRSQLACCHEGYELRNKGAEFEANPLVDVYMKVTKSDSQVEYFDGSAAYDWAEKHPELLDYGPIKTEYEKCKNMLVRFEKGTLDFQDSDWAGLEKLAREREIRMKDSK